MQKVGFHTLGCKVNQYETEAMSELFEAKGYQVVDGQDWADVYVINTCTVTNLGDKKSRQFIRRAKRMNPNAIVAVVGCYSQVAPDAVKDIEGVNLVIGTNDRRRVVDLVQDLNPFDKVVMVGDIMQVREFEELEIDRVKDKTRAFLKIQEGCNQYCSYCIIPYARGPIRSRKPENVLSEVKRLAAGGFKEIVLTGIHVASYGKDLDDVTLLDVLQAVHDVEGIERIRLSSLEPRLFTDAFIQAIQDMPKFCQHFHLSLQSGSDTVLKRMNRKYTTSDYKEIVDRLQRELDSPSFTTDVIVGFPEETDAEFEETLAFVQAVQFAQMHVFKYSPREGTPAAKMTGQVHGDVKSSRSERLMAVADEMERKWKEGYMGRRVRVLFEGKSDDLENHIEGLTDEYLRVAVPGSEELLGTLQQVTVEGEHGDVLIGTIK